VAENRLNQRDG
jgi:hypothetical protein